VEASTVVTAMVDASTDFEAALYKLKVAMITTAESATTIADIFISYTLSSKLSIMFATCFQRYLVSNDLSDIVELYNFADPGINPLGEEWFPNQFWNAVRAPLFMPLVTPQFMDSSECAKEVGHAFMARSMSKTTDTMGRRPDIMPIFLAETEEERGHIFEMLKRPLTASLRNNDDMNRMQLLSMNGITHVVREYQPSEEEDEEEEEGEEGANSNAGKAQRELDYYSGKFEETYKLAVEAAMKVKDEEECARVRVAPSSARGVKH